MRGRMFERWTTVRWGRRAARALAGRLREREFWTGVAAWYLTLAATLACVAFAVDFVLTWRAGAGVRQLIVIPAMAAALGCLTAVVLLPPFVLVSEAANAIGARPSWRRHLWPLPLVVAAAIAPLLVVDRYQWRAAFWLTSGASALALFVVALCGYHGWRLGARVVAGVIGVVAIAADVSTPRLLYRDLHDLAAIMTISAALVVLSPRRHRLREEHPAPLRRRVIFLVVAALVATALPDALAPGWRALAYNVGHYEPREARLLRRLVDFDGDGFSPVAWGGDCDDFDASRNPLAREDVVGRDKNCNGFRLPAKSTDDDRGLLSGLGNPDAAGVDLALLITVDCWSRDTLRPDVMPRLSEWVRRGVSFTRLYSGGSRTHLSLPLLLRPFDSALPVATRLAASGIHSTAVLGYLDKQMGEIVAGFELADPQSYEKPFHPELGPPALIRGVDVDADATALTNRAIADVRKTDGARHFLWVHYFDAHWPYHPRDAHDRVAAPPGSPKDYALYLAELHHIDAEIGRLLDELDRSGRLAHSVVIVTSDHGEGFGRHNVRYHGVSAYEMLVHVPGFILAPGLAPGVYERLVSHRDVPPTILGAFGLVAHDAEAERFGRSWLRLRSAANEPMHRFVVVRSSGAVDVSGFVRPEAAIIGGPLKLVVMFDDGLTEAYDVVRDPDEQHDLASEARLGVLRRSLELYRDIDGYP